MVHTCVTPPPPPAPCACDTGAYANPVTVASWPQHPCLLPDKGGCHPSPPPHTVERASAFPYESHQPLRGLLVHGTACTYCLLLLL